MRRFFLTEREWSDLAALMQPVIGADRVDEAIAAIDMAADMAVWEITTGPASLRRTRGARQRHCLEVERHTAELLRLLEQDQPLYGTLGVDWALMRAWLEQVRTAANAEQPDLAGKPRRGRPAFEWRDRLIAVIHSVYPKDSAKLTLESNFEITVERVLQYIGDRVPEQSAGAPVFDLQDVHGLVVRALQRLPKPPFTVTAAPRRRSRLRIAR